MTPCQSCLYHLTYRCPCQKAKCRVQSPAFRQGGANCTQHKPMRT